VLGTPDMQGMNDYNDRKKHFIYCMIGVNSVGMRNSPHSCTGPAGQQRGCYLDCRNSENKTKPQIVPETPQWWFGSADGRGRPTGKNKLNMPDHSHVAKMMGFGNEFCPDDCQDDCAHFYYGNFKECGYPNGYPYKGYGPGDHQKRETKTPGNYCQPGVARETGNEVFVWCEATTTTTTTTTTTRAPCSSYQEEGQCPERCSWSVDVCRDKPCSDYSATTCPDNCASFSGKWCFEPPCSIFDEKDCPPKCSWKDGGCKETTATTTPQPKCADLSTMEMCNGKDCWWHNGMCSKPPCGEHTKETCPAAETCKWDGEKNECVVRKCVDYTTEETCPENCNWSGGICNPTLPFELCPTPGKVGSNECPDGCVPVDDCDECAAASEYWIQQGKVKKDYSDSLWPERSAPRPQGCFRNKGWKQIKCNPFGPDEKHANGRRAVGPKKNKAPICKKEAKCECVTNR